MADSWNTLEAADLSQLSERIDSVQGTISTVSQILDGISNVLSLIAQFLPSQLSLLGAATQALVAALEQFYEDLLHNQVGLAVHHNLTWNPGWSLSDYEEDPTNLPFRADGMTGWLAGISASAENPSDPASPLTDSNTQVAGLMIIKGITSNAELRQLKALYDAFTDYSDFADIFNTEEDLEEATEEEKKLARLGPIFNSPFARSRTEEGRGAPPYWLLASVGKAIPIVGRFAELLKEIAANLRPAIAASDQLSRLAEALAYRAALLSNAAEELNGILDTIESLIAFFNGAEIILLDMEEGGFSTFVGRAAAAENLPDYGSNGMVAGLVIMATADNPWNTVQTLFERLGLIGELSDVEAATLEANVEASFDEVEFP